MDDSGNEKLQLGPSDIANGYNTIEQKVESLCPFFYRWDALFGSRQNVAPSFLYETGQPVVSNIPHFNEEDEFRSNSIEFEDANTSFDLELVTDA